MFQVAAVGDTVLASEFLASVTCMQTQAAPAAGPPLLAVGQHPAPFYTQTALPLSSSAFLGATHRLPLPSPFLLLSSSSSHTSRLSESPTIMEFLSTVEEIDK